MRLAHEVGALYIDTVCEPWPGFYTDPRLTLSQRSNYALREEVLDQRAALGTRARPPSPAAAPIRAWSPGSSNRRCSMSPPMSGKRCAIRRRREDWARLAMTLGVKGIHIAERDTQRAKTPKPMGVFVNTWSVEGFVSEGLQPAELGWGTHEKHLPPEGKTHGYGSGLRDLSAAPRRRHARALLDADGQSPARLARHPQ